MRLVVLCAVVLAGTLAACSDDAGPDFTTPEGTLEELMRAHNELDWSAEFRLYAPDSRGNLLLPFAILPKDNEDLAAAMKAHLVRHVAPAPPGQVDPREMFASFIDRIADPEGFYVGGRALLHEHGELRSTILRHEEIRVEGETASARQVVRYRLPTRSKPTDLENPVRLVKADGRWWMSLGR